MICWTLAQAPAPSRHTLSLDPAAANASYEPPVPGASVPVPAGTGGSAPHAPSGPPMLSARPPPSSTQALWPGPNPSARTLPVLTGPVLTGPVLTGPVLTV